MTDGHGLARAVRIVLIVAVVTLVCVALFALIAVPSILSTGSATDKVQEGTDLSGCRAGFSSAVQEATSQLTVDKSVLDVHTSAALRAAVDRDQVALQAALADSPRLEALVVADGEAVLARTTEYRAAVQQSKDDPMAFLKSCKEKNP